MSDKKPYLNEIFADNGEHSHWELIDSDGVMLWTQDVNNESMDTHHVSASQQPKGATGAKELVEAILIIGARRADPNLNHDTAKPLIEQNIEGLAKRVESFATSQPPTQISDAKIKLKAEQEFKKEPDGYSMDLLLLLRSVWFDSAKWYKDQGVNSAPTITEKPNTDLIELCLRYFYPQTPSITTDELNALTVKIIEILPSPKKLSGQHKGKEKKTACNICNDKGEYLDRHPESYGIVKCECR